MVVLKNTGLLRAWCLHLAPKSVEGASLPLQGIDDVQGGHSLAASMLGVGHCIPDDVFQEHLEHASGLFVDEPADSLDTTATSKTTDGRLCDALDVVTQHLAMALGTTLSKTLASLPRPDIVQKTG